MTDHDTLYAAASREIDALRARADAAEAALAGTEAGADRMAHDLAERIRAARALADELAVALREHLAFHGCDKVPSGLAVHQARQYDALAKWEASR